MVIDCVVEVDNSFSHCKNCHIKYNYYERPYRHINCDRITWSDSLFLSHVRAGITLHYRSVNRWYINRYIYSVICLDIVITDMISWNGKWKIWCDLKKRTQKKKNDGNYVAGENYQVNSAWHIIQNGNVHYFQSISDAKVRNLQRIFLLLHTNTQAASSECILFVVFASILLELTL